MRQAVLKQNVSSSVLDVSEATDDSPSFTSTCMHWFQVRTPRSAFPAVHPPSDIIHDSTCRGTMWQYRTCSSSSHPQVLSVTIVMFIQSKPHAQQFPILQGHLCTWFQARSLQHHAGPNHHGALCSFNPIAKYTFNLDCILRTWLLRSNDLSGHKRHAAIRMFAWTLLHPSRANIASCANRSGIMLLFAASLSYTSVSFGDLHCTCAQEPGCNRKAYCSDVSTSDTHMYR